MKLFLNYIVTNAKAILLILAVGTGLLGELKEFFRKKKWFRLTTIGLIIVAAGLQYENDKEDATKHLKEYENSIIAGNNTIKKLNIEFATIKVMQVNIDKQLNLQKKITDGQSFLLKQNNIVTEQNKVVTEQTKDILTHVKRTLSPLFPLKIEICYQVPLNEFKNIAVEFIEQNNKDTLENRNKTKIGLPYYRLSPNYLAVINPQINFPVEARRENALLGYNDIELTNLPLTPPIVTSRLFLIPFLFYKTGSEKFEAKYETLLCNLKLNKLYVTIVYEETKFQNYWVGSVPTLGFDDFENCKISFRHGGDYILRYIEFSNSSNTRFCSINFSEKDIVQNSRSYSKKYVRIITDTNFRPSSTKGLLPIMSME